MRVLFLAIIIGFFQFSGSCQTLFTYGKYAVDANDFLRAFNKNNTQVNGNRSKAIREYLDLYINSRLKIREAYDRRFDTLPQVITEVGNLRSQIAQNYLNDPTVTARLQQEAFLRSQKDIHIAHIFISFKNAQRIDDTTAARQKKDELMSRLKKAEDFARLAQTFSDDTTARTNGGDLGWITVFTLPYPLENLAYSLPVGKYSEPITSSNGYHIIKKIGERKALGKMKAQQILIALPPGSNEAEKKRTGALADSIYKLIQKGSRFETLATTYSNDYISAATGGNIPYISVGQYDPVFEKMVWALTKDSSYTKPFLTSHGWHIVKRLELRPVVTDSTDQPYRQELLDQIRADARWTASRDFLYKKIADKGRLVTGNYADADLFLFTDSTIGVNKGTVSGRLSGSTMILKLGEKQYNANDWVQYASTQRFGQDGRLRTYEQIKKEWIRNLVNEYYIAHLEDFNEEFRYQMAEFQDGNLFFEIMQQEIWNKAQNDTAALHSLFEKNKDNYNWQKSADAVIFYCADENSAREIHAAVKKNPADWKKITEQYAEKVVAESSQYEWEQLPLPSGVSPTAGLVTAPVVNKNDNSASFAYIIRVFPNPVPRSFAEAKGLVINDYQEILEKAWIEKLKKKYPVEVNQKVLADISK